jgi:hypothetical protein
LHGGDNEVRLQLQPQFGVRITQFPDCPLGQLDRLYDPAYPEHRPGEYLIRLRELQRAPRLDCRRSQVVKGVGAAGVHLGRAELKEHAVSLLNRRRLKQRT